VTTGPIIGERKVASSPRGSLPWGPTLKRLLADAELEIEALREIAWGNV
jgi:hypothetical protein